MKIKDQIQADETPIVMSLREKYFERMITRQKSFEFRKRYRKNNTFAFIYISKTKKSIIGAVRFGEPIIDNIEKIAEIAESESVSSYNGMLEYLEGKELGYAIPLKEVFRFKKVLSLVQLREQFAFTPPQSYSLLKNEDKLKKYLYDLEIADQITIQNEPNWQKSKDQLSLFDLYQ